MQHNTCRVALALLAAFGAELLTLTYWQVARSSDLWNARGNRRPLLVENRILRGAILDRNGQPIARSRSRDGRSSRPLGQIRETTDPLAFAHVVGYLSRAYGRVGLEGRYNAELSGVKREWTVEDIQNQLLGKQLKGNDVFLTIDRRLQVAAFKALGKRRGAVVAIIPATGEVLALASWPSYNPDTIDKDWKALNENKGRPLVGRATRGLYPPGSSFKIVTYAANEQIGAVADSTEFFCDGKLQLDRYVVHESEGHAHGPVTPPMALARSCNVAFAQIAMKIGVMAFEDVAKKFGLGERIPFELPLETSFVRREQTVMTGNLLAQSGFGQGQVVVTPMQMALITAAIGNRGVMMQPQLVKEVRTYDGKPLLRIPSRAWRQVVRAEAAQATYDAMKLTTTQGTATGIFVRLPFTVAGKTGTAQNPHGRPHAWFVALAPASSEQPRIAIAVIVENGGYGSKAAAPIARKVLQEWAVSR